MNAPLAEGVLNGNVVECPFHAAKFDVMTGKKVTEPVIARPPGADKAPPEMLPFLASLGACTSITPKMVAARRQIPMMSVEVELQLNPGGKLEAGNDIVRHITLVGELSDEQRAQLLKVANACPMHKLLTGEVRIQTKLTS